MRTDVVIVGAGQAGLAMSHCLTARSVDHIVLERGEVAQSWRTERWDSLRLLTPNWLSRLPGQHYTGKDPDGYMSAAEVVDYLVRYRNVSSAPVCTHTTVASVRRSSRGVEVLTDNGRWSAGALVIASGASSDPHIPGASAGLPRGTAQLTALGYRRPEQLEDGGVLVVGASASGVQIADELRRSGRDVTLAVGEHVRVPRHYRGRDIHGWLDELGYLDQRYDEVPDLRRARRLRSLQAVGGPPERTLDLNALSSAGVRLTGRLVGVSGRRLQFSGALAHVAMAADLKQDRLLDRIDAAIGERRRQHRYPAAERPARTSVTSAGTELEVSRFRTVLWATGYRPRHTWLDPGLLDRRGNIVHDGGVTSVPGVYVLGLPFTRRRKSSLLDGVGPDAQELAAHVEQYLRGAARAA